MPVCTRCKKDWPEQYWVCPEDGTVLVAAARAAGAGDTWLSTLASPVGIPREEDLAPGTMIGEYRVEGKLGEGGMATVFSATQPLIGKKVAIKVISRRLCADPLAVERFIGEARTVNQIGHPNLVDIFAFGVLPDGRAHLVMEWLQGETLEARLQRARLPVPRALDVLLQIVDALEAAHEKGVVHRDLKPANIFLVERRGASGVSLAIKLLDFGIAKLADSDASVPKTRSGVAMGTAGYMSPEQARGRNVDHRTDIYALGCVAYEALLGRVPFVADTAIDILAMHLASAPPSPRSWWAEMPPSLERTLVDMLAKEPDKRPSLSQVRATLVAAQRSITPTMGIPIAAAPLRRARQRRAALVGAIASALLMAGGAAAWRFGRARSSHAGSAAPATVKTARATPPAAKLASATPPAVKLASATPPPAKLASATPPVDVATATGTILVRVPAGASVRIDGEEQPDDGSGVVRAKVASDRDHAVVIAAPHRQPWSEHVRVAPGATAELSVPPRHDHPTAAPRPPEEPARAPVKKGDSRDDTLDPF
jgi:tRNA A-37 threonylcarbamoyl transferase component Bud32